MKVNFPLKKDKIEELIEKRHSYEQQQNYIKLESLQQKIDLLKTDVAQFQNDFKMLTEPFVGDKAKSELLKRKLSIKKSETLKDPAATQQN